MDQRGNVLLGAALGKSSFWSRDYNANHEHNGVSALGIAGAAFLGEVPGAERWLAAAKVAEQRISQNTSADGTSPEGIPYWSYGMTFLLSYIECTHRLIDSDELYQSEYFRHIGSYRLYSSTCDLSKTLPWGDAPPRDYYGPQHLLFRIASQYRQPATQWLGLHLPFSPAGFSDVKAWELLWYDRTVPATPPEVLDHLFQVGQMSSSRSGWGNGDYLLAVKAGPTNANHSHLDAGAIAFAFGPDWLLTAPGYGKGAESPDYWNQNRWSFYSNATEGESTLLINGKNQRTDTNARGNIDHFLGGWKWCWTGVDLSQAYSDISDASRLIIHRRNDYILVIDRIEAPQPVTAEWLLQAGGEIHASGGALEMKAPSGSLTAKMIVPNFAFAPRQPTSPRIDAPNPIHTYAVAQNGGNSLFACLLQPHFASDPSPEIGTTVISTEKDTLGLELQLADAVDSVRVRKVAGSMEIAAPAPDGASVKAVALALVCRWSDGKALTLSGEQAQSLAWSEGSIQFSTPTTFALEQLPNGAWVLDLATATIAGLSLGRPDASLIQVDERGASKKSTPLAGQLSLNAGRYLIVPFGTDATSCLEQMTRELPSHASP